MKIHYGLEVKEYTDEVLARHEGMVRDLYIHKSHRVRNEDYEKERAQLRKRFKSVSWNGIDYYSEGIVR